MSSITKRLEEWKDLELVSEDEFPLNLELEAPATVEWIAEVEGRLGLQFPSELRELYSLSDGGDFFGHMLVPTGQMRSLVAGRALIPFGDWGNGDHDCVVAEGDPEFAEGEVVVFLHALGKVARVAPSLLAWMEGFVEETRSEGAVPCPYDFIHRPGAQGLYRAAYDECVVPYRERKRAGQAPPPARAAPPAAMPAEMAADHEASSEQHPVLKAMGLEKWLDTLVCAVRGVTNEDAQHRAKILGFREPTAEEISEARKRMNRPEP